LPVEFRQEHRDEDLALGTVWLRGFPDVHFVLAACLARACEERPWARQEVAARAERQRREERGPGGSARMRGAEARRVGGVVVEAPQERADGVVAHWRLWYGDIVVCDIQLHESLRCVPDILRQRTSTIGSEAVAGQQQAPYAQ